jgi:hexulose-6-phosphate isomerase
VHFKDFKKSVGTAEGFCDLLEGDVNWPTVMQAFREIGYDGFVTAEMMPYRKDLLDVTSRAMDKILKM